ncbi:MAG: hypothetical protein IPG17_27750 [Sandaracinaceae bacterium]|nr:hypothetical protein [Sandaracinaceae bacterium]
MFRRIVEEVLPKVAANAAYQNAKRNTPDTARLEYDRALGQVMLTFLKEEPELYKKFVQDPSFKRFLAGDGMSPASARPTSARPKRPASVGPSPASTSARSAPASTPRPSVRAAPSVGSLRLVRFLLPNMRVARPKLSREALVLLQEQGVYATAPDREGLYATKPTWGTATEEMRRMLRDVPGVRERDVTAEYVFGRTRAARDYDYPWTLSLDESDPARRLVALPPGNLAHQVGRYESGNHRFERVLTSRADVIADMVERTDRGEITSDLADAALQAHDRVLDQLGKPMSDDPRAVAAYQAALGAGGKDSRAVPAPSASQRPASSRRGAPASRVPASSRRAPFSTTTPSGPAGATSKDPAGPGPRPPPPAGW